MIFPYEESIRRVENPYIRLTMTLPMMERKTLANAKGAEICPPGNFRISPLSQDRMVLQEGYKQGRSLASEAIARWNTV